MNRQMMNRQTDKQTNRQTDKQTNRQTDKQTNRLFNEWLMWLFITSYNTIPLYLRAAH